MAPALEEHQARRAKSGGLASCVGDGEDAVAPAPQQVYRRFEFSEATIEYEALGLAARVCQNNPNGR